MVHKSMKIATIGGLLSIRRFSMMLGATNRKVCARACPETVIGAARASSIAQSCPCHEHSVSKPPAELNVVGTSV